MWLYSIKCYLITYNGNLITLWIRKAAQICSSLHMLRTVPSAPLRCPCRYGSPCASVCSSHTTCALQRRATTLPNWSTMARCRSASLHPLRISILLPHAHFAASSRAQSTRVWGGPTKTGRMWRWTRIGTMNIEDGLRPGDIGEQGSNMDDDIDTCDIFSLLNYTILACYKPFMACERSEVTRSSITVVVNLLPNDS